MKNKISRCLQSGKCRYALLTLAILILVAITHAFLTIPEEHIDEDRLNAIILNAATKYKVSPALVKAVIWRESKFKPSTVGKAGEIGLMQIMPGAIEDWMRVNKIKFKPSRRELFTPEKNVDIGTWYLAWTGQHWDGYVSKEILQLSEYNAGYGNVTKNWKPASPSTEVKIEDISFKSTRQYVKDIIDKKKEYSSHF